jgi:hypothetical protein
VSASVSGFLSEMTVGDVFDRAFTVYKRQFFNLVGLYSVVLLPFIMLNGVILLEPDLFPLSTVAGLLSTLAGYMAEAVLAVLIGQVVLGKPVNRRQAFGAFAGWRFFALLGTILLWSVFLLLGTLFCLVPAVYLFVIFAFLAQVMGLEGRFGFEAFTRSRDLARGSWWMIFGILLAILVLIFTLSLSITSVLGAIFGFGFSGFNVVSEEPDYMFSVIYQMSSQIVTILMNPLEVCIITMLYFNLRVRKEGLDLEERARNLGLLTAGR